MNSPLLTVTITNYNYGHFVGRAIESILAQTFRDFELIIIDNASTDNSVAIIQQYAANDERIRLVAREQNQGLTASLRQSCELARGRYRVHIDADDWVIDPHAFERQIDMLESDTEIAFVYSPICLYDLHGKQIYVKRAHEQDVIAPGEIEIDFALRTYVMHSGPMIRMDAYRMFGGYDPTVRFNVDISLATKLCGQGKVGYINQPLYAFCQHGPSLTSTAKEQLLLEECMRVIDDVFTSPIAKRIANPAEMRHRAIGHRLLLNPRNHVFAGRHGAGWKAYAQNIRIRPYETLVQKEGVVLLARTVLGNRGYTALISTISFLISHLPHFSIEFLSL